jgi:hypothetical protein
MPDHTTLSRRSKHLDINLCPPAKSGPFDILIDSTGLRVHSGNQVGPPPKRRAWRKLHIVIDADTGHVLASTLTTNRAGDRAQVPALLAQVDEDVKCAMADGAYDTASVHSALDNHSAGLRIIIPPRRDAKASQTYLRARQRDAAVRAIDDHGRRRWAQDSGYTRRSLVETTMSQCKQIIGRSMRSRNARSQETEATLACAILNTMADLGMPDSYCIK